MNFVTTIFVIKFDDLVGFHLNLEIFSICMDFKIR